MNVEGDILDSRHLHLIDTTLGPLLRNRLVLHRRAAHSDRNLQFRHPPDGKPSTPHAARRASLVCRPKADGSPWIK